MYGDFLYIYTILSSRADRSAVAPAKCLIRSGWDEGQPTEASTARLLWPLLTVCLLRRNPEGKAHADAPEECLSGSAARRSRGSFCVYSLRCGFASEVKKRRTQVRPSESLYLLFRSKSLREGRAEFPVALVLLRDVPRAQDISRSRLEN